MHDRNIIEGDFVVRDARFAIVATRWNGFIVDQLAAGAEDALRRHGIPDKDVHLIRVPGAYELPLAAKKAAASGQYDALVALGTVIRGGTPHFEYVAGECAKGLSSVQLELGVPLGFGVLTVETVEQALERAGTKGGNKGAEAALSALEMVSLLRRLEG